MEKFRGGDRHRCRQQQFKHEPTVQWIANLATTLAPIAFFTLIRARICKPFKEPRNRFSAWRAGTITLFDVPARQATWAAGIDSWAPEAFTNTGSEKNTRIAGAATTSQWRKRELADRWRRCCTIGTE